LDDEDENKNREKEEDEEEEKDIDHISSSKYCCNNTTVIKNI